eukprot:gnl/MRDRNA2_/MRDRNA2_92074_c0_seq1.p1 gnl/MRDRNA2_/MRDRNA2_92074_c0~~gnl/MRDRNA2_/MRDRNA2_92074_c0_seq1.p1  ORF type:complete len:278 (-),score=87.07 gnl/MRDRNA2_/MRDRNA2_92074_c0_seq1:177-1010(-)
MQAAPTTAVGTTTTTVSVQQVPQATSVPVSAAYQVATVAPPPAPPQDLTVNMPDPVAIAKQKAGYMKMLDDQLKEGTNVLEQQLKYAKDYLYGQAAQQKKQYIMQIDQQVKSQEMALTQQYSQQLMSLQQQAAQQKAALEQQSMQLTMEYQRKKAESDMLMQQWEMQKTQYDMQVQMNEQMAKMYQREAVQEVKAEASAATALPTGGLTPPFPSYAQPIVLSSAATLPSYGSFMPAPTTTYGTAVTYAPGATYSVQPSTVTVTETVTSKAVEPPKER